MNISAKTGFFFHYALNKLYIIILQKLSITHNKNLNPLLNLLINCISITSAPHILSIKDERTFFLNFLIIGLCNSSADFLLETISFLTVFNNFISNSSFLSKNL